jgi:hypothetical protein
MNYESGYAALVERSAKACLPLLGGASAGGRAPVGGYASQEEAAGHVQTET